MTTQISRIALALTLTMAGGAIGASGAAAQPDPDNRPPVSGIDPSQYGTVERIAGRDRVATSIEASKAISKTHDVTTVVVTRGDNFPDALATVPLADIQDAPVLLNNVGAGGRETLDPRVAAEIKRLGATKVIILGDRSSVGESAQRALENIVGYDNVDRVGGANRYETAYMIAADTAAAYGSPFADELADAKSQYRAAVLAERRYQEAVGRYESAAKSYSDARREYLAATAAYAAQLEKITELASTLKDVPDVPPGYGSWVEYIQEAQEEFTQANRSHDQATAALSTLAVTLGALDGQGETTLDITSTLGEYKVEFPQLTSQIQNAQNVFGLTDATTLEDALQIATLETNRRADALVPLAAELSDRVAEMQRAAAAVEANKPILEQLGRENVLLSQLKLRFIAADRSLSSAYDRLLQAQEALAAATVARPAPGELEDRAQLVASSRDQVVRGAGNRTAFISDGKVAPFAMVSGPVAAHKKGVVLLSQGQKMNSWTQRYIRLSNAQTVGVGKGGSTAVGTNTTRTFPSSDAAQVANQMGQLYFDGTAVIAVASIDPWADSVTGGSFVSQYDGLLLLTENDRLNSYADDYIKFSATEMELVDIVLLGNRIGNDVRDEILDSIHF